MKLATGQLRRFLIDVQKEDETLYTLEYCSKLIKSKCQHLS
jgi:hypothetical protein